MFFWRSSKEIAKGKCHVSIFPIHFTPTQPAPAYAQGGEHKREAWKVRRLMTEFARAARRPHWPREVAMRELFAVAGIENPNAGGDGDLD